MRITIVIDDADAAAATEAAQTISRAFVGTAGSSVPASGAGTAHPVGPSAHVVDVDVGPAPHVDGGPPAGSSSSSGPGSAPESGSDGNGSQPATPNPATHPPAESVGAAPDLGGG